MFSSQRVHVCVHVCACVHMCASKKKFFLKKIGIGNLVKRKFCFTRFQNLVKKKGFFNRFQTNLKQTFFY